MRDRTQARVRRARVAAVATAALTLALGTAAVGPTAAGAEAGLSVTITGGERGSPHTDVVVDGTYTCGPFAGGVPDRGVLDLTVTQARRGVTATAYGYLEPTTCDGTPQAFTAQLTGTSPQRFRSGPASWSASGYVEGDGGVLQHTSVPPTAFVLGA